MPSIRLDKKTKTIKVVNRTNRVKLSNPSSRIDLKHTGKTGPASTVPGPEGDKGDTGESTFVRAHHGSDPSVARPNALYVEWVGSIAPTNATTEDTWVRT